MWRTLKPEEKDPERLWGLVVFPLLLAASVLTVFVWPLWGEPSCRFHRWTGLPCLTCGSSRAFVHLVHGRLGDAVQTQPLVVVLSAAYAAYAAYAAAVVFFGLPRFRPGIRIRRRTWLGGAILLLIANWAYLILRNA